MMTELLHWSANPDQIGKSVNVLTHAAMDELAIAGGLVRSRR